VNGIFLLIQFAAPSSLLRERSRPSDLRIVGNGPPGTFVLFPDGLRVSLPTDQIVFADDAVGFATVGFGGMQFIGEDDGTLVFERVREVLPEDQLSPARSHTMRLDARWVTAVVAEGRQVAMPSDSGRAGPIDTGEDLIEWVDASIGKGRGLARKRS
jgi:hypothetical protein